MEELTKSQKGRLAIRAFKTTADALILRGNYKPSGKSGRTLETALKDISPEIYGTINDPRSIELDGLEYVLDRLPRGIEECSRIILTAQEDLEQTAFEKIEPRKRRRVSYRMSDKEICFVITRGWSEVYDVLTHLTFLNIEAQKINVQMHDKNQDISTVWQELEKNMALDDDLVDKQLDQAIWNLSILLGRTYQETRHTYESLENGRKEHNSNNGLFRIIYQLGKRIEEEKASKDDELLIYFTPSFQDMIGSHKISRAWARTIKERLSELGLLERPLHIVSANMHSTVNLLYGYAALEGETAPSDRNVVDFIKENRQENERIAEFAGKHGLYHGHDVSGANIDYQIIDTVKAKDLSIHPDIQIDATVIESEKPVVLIIDYAFGTQAFEIMEELLSPNDEETANRIRRIESISIMGKAGILPGKKGDIMLATAHVLEGTPHNYLVSNDLKQSDFDNDIDVYEGLIVTVLGTSLQNRDVLERFQTTSWKAVGLEMEGGHYQRAINAAIIKGHISNNVKTRYAYYASDNPLHSGQTLASGSMGEEGIRPTYLITKLIVEKIINQQ
ncbi:MAG: hypothetical protein GY866_28775 [Proteobacteria bacterium]|nr:hypothetical protein [Pseudomonadota bacterium]